jgi:glutamate-ammonia-ligase adenylyltransferase
VGTSVDALLPAVRAAGSFPRELSGHPELAARLHARLAAEADDEEAQLLALRQFKRERVLHILALDLDGVLDLAQVSGALSDLAELLLGTVLSRVSARMGLGEHSPIGVIGYGKLGSREMSYASDTDIVFVYDGTSDEPEADLARLAITANRWITAVTPAGVLYETDFRLRPYGNGGLLVTPFSGFREYQREHARAWEHQALTRARWIAGAGPLARAFAELRREVLARPRDPRALATEVMAMRDRIFAAHGSTGPDFDVKHSRGGVIDVEFVVQYLVLRHGGAHPVLLEGTDNAGTLAHAARLGLVSPSLAAQATAAFERYRLWMHRERLRGSEQVRVLAVEAEAHRIAVEELWREVLVRAAQA